MTESEWWAATDSRRWAVTGKPHGLIRWLYSDTRACDRKLRLFCIACCRRLRRFLSDFPAIQYLDAFEDYAEGKLSHSELLRRVKPADQPLVYPPPEDVQLQELNIYMNDNFVGLCSASKAVERAMERLRAPHEVGSRSGCYPADLSWLAALAPPDTQCSYYEELVAHHQLLHDIFGALPFRDLVLDPSWLTTDVQMLTRGIYDEKAFDRMPILADALQDAGCDNEEFLAHCRAENWEHVRGCWVIDLLLGKPWQDAQEMQQ